MPTKREKLLKAIREGKVKDETTLAVFAMVSDLEDKIDEELPNIKNIIERMKGEDGHTPTEEELIDLIKPLIPEPITGEDGHTPTDAELLKLIKPLIPKIENGKTPTKKELLDLIIPLIPKIQEIDIDQIISEATKKVKDQIKIPELDDRQKIVEKINTGKDKDLKIQSEQVENFDKLATNDALNRAISILDQRTQFLINKKTSTGGGTWGSITGTLSDQIDLQTALDARSLLNHSISQHTFDADVDLGNHNLYLGIEGGTGNIYGKFASTPDTEGGGINIVAGSGLGIGGGGEFNFIAGNGGEMGTGGGFSVSAGDGGATSGNGGDTQFNAGNAQGGNGNGGSIQFISGSANGAGTNGVLKFRSNPSIVYGILDFSNLTTSDKTFTFPNLSGTLALMGASQTTDFTTTGLGTFGSLLVDSPTLAVNVPSYTDKIGFGTADPDNIWEFSDGTPTNTFAGIGMLLRNPTAADGTTTFRMSPAMILSAQGKGATNQQYQWAQAMTPSGSADNLTFRYYYKFGAGSWTVHPFYLDTSSGFIIAGTVIAEDIYKAPNTFNLLNTTAATVSVDQYSPPISWASQGWKTASTAGTQYMGLLQVNAPEQGVISPIGVHKWMYGINTYGNSISEVNELMRLQWGSDAGITGVFFNQKNLANYVVAINNDSTYLKFGTGQDAGITYDGVNMLLNPKLVGSGYLNIQGQTLLDDKLMFTQTDGNEYIDSLNDGYLDLVATTQIRFNSKMTIDGNGRVALYNNIATEGYGVPAIIDSINLTEQTAAISDTTFSNASATGLYRINFYIFTAVADVAQTVTLKLKWNDGVVARSVSAAAINTGTTDYNQGVYYVYLGAGSVQYETTISGSLEDGSYELHISVERLN